VGSILLYYSSKTGSNSSSGRAAYGIQQPPIDNSCVDLALPLKASEGLKSRCHALSFRALQGFHKVISALRSIFVPRHAGGYRRGRKECYDTLAPAKSISFGLSSHSEPADVLPQRLCGCLDLIVGALTQRSPHAPTVGIYQSPKSVVVLIFLSALSQSLGSKPEPKKHVLVPSPYRPRFRDTGILLPGRCSRCLMDSASVRLAVWRVGR